MPPEHLHRVLATLDATPRTAAELRALGVHPQALARLVKQGHVQRIRRGWYVTSDAHQDGHLLEPRFRSLHLPDDCAIAHRSAARVWGLRLPHLDDLDDDRLWLLRQRRQTRPRVRQDVVYLPAGYLPQHITEVEGLRLTTLARTAMDLARGCSFERALAVTDHALALGATSEECTALMHYMWRWPHSRVLRPAVQYANALSESGLESMCRGVMLASGLPAPALQVPLLGASGAWYRADIFYPDARLIIECDGREKYDSREALIAEKLREDDLREAGFTVVRLTYRDLYDESRRRLQGIAHVIDTALQPYDPEFGRTVLPERLGGPRRRSSFG